MSSGSSSDSGSDSEDTGKKDKKAEKRKRKEEKKKRKARKKELKRVLKEAKKRKKAQKKDSKKRRRLNGGGSDSEEEGKWVMVNGQTVRVPVGSASSNVTFALIQCVPQTNAKGGSKQTADSGDDSDFEWGGSSGGITIAQRTKAEQKQFLHRQKALAMQRVDNSAAIWRAHAEVQF
jgi:hypothetical protein